jgi:arylsulfatase A-like enzyme
MKTLFVLLPFVVGMAVSAADTVNRPNIVLMMADDQGWGDVGYHGHPELKTPNLDALASAGLRLDRFYTAHCNCSPTRASIMTGRNPNRMGTFSPGAPIRAQELTVAKVLQSAGYSTGHFGKWHLNGKNGDKNTKEVPGRAILESDPLSPGKLGFDEWVSADNFFDLDPVLGRNGVPEKFHGDSSDVTTDEALKFITRQATGKKPFFAVVWFGSPHVPHEALPADKAAYSKLSEAEQNYFGEISAVDRNVGRVRTALRELKVSDNTLLWYCSDNGGHEGPKSTGFLRGEKGTLWEGGLRVPGIVEWPARIRKPAVSEFPCCTFDMYSTILDATGAVAQNQIQPLDGISLMPLIDGKMTERGKSIPFWNNAGRPQGASALLAWPYKLHLNPADRRRKNTEELPAVMLFDVSKDPKETTNLASAQPERVTAMTKELEAWKASVENSLAGGDYAQPVDPPAKKKRKNAANSK